MVKAAAFCLALLVASPAQACRLALVLAMDVSSSVDAAEDALQRQGLARALTAHAVQDAFFVSGDPVALYVFEWSGRGHQTTLVPWTLIRTPTDLADASLRIARSQRAASGLPTAMGHALAHAAISLSQAPDCLFQTIDVSGDGANNDGFGPQNVYATFPVDGVTVNGLVIETDAAGARNYYESTVKRGSLSFVEVAQGFADFEAAMTRKLVRELSAQVIGGLSTQGLVFQ